MVADKGSHMDKVSKKEDREGTIILHYTCEYYLCNYNANNLLTPCCPPWHLGFTRPAETVTRRKFPWALFKDSHSRRWTERSTYGLGLLPGWGGL